MAVQSAASTGGRQHTLPASQPVAALPAHSKQTLKAMGLALLWLSDAKAANALGWLQ